MLFCRGTTETKAVNQSGPFKTTVIWAPETWSFWTDTHHRHHEHSHHKFILWILWKGLNINMKMIWQFKHSLVDDQLISEGRCTLREPPFRLRFLGWYDLSNRTLRHWKWETAQAANPPTVRSVSAKLLWSRSIFFLPIFLLVFQWWTSTLPPIYITTVFWAGSERPVASSKMEMGCSFVVDSMILME